MMTETDSGDGGYFPMGERSRSRSASPSSIRSDSMSIHLTEPSATMAAFTALQYLPVPVLVLSAQKTVVLANEAMGRLFGIDLEGDHDLSIAEALQDKTMGDLGVDILQNGSPILITWEVRYSPCICPWINYLTFVELSGLRNRRLNSKQLRRRWRFSYGQRPHHTDRSDHAISRKTPVNKTIAALKQYKPCANNGTRRISRGGHCASFFGSRRHFEKVRKKERLRKCNAGILHHIHLEH